MTREWLLFLLLLGFSFTSGSQNLSLYGGSYSRINNSQVNPANIVNSTSYLEIAPMGGFGTFRNSYLYLRDTDLSSKALDRFDKEQHNFFGHAELTLASFELMSKK